MILGYNTNGFAFHKLEDAIRLLAEIGYRSAAITLEHHHLDPPDQRGVPAALAFLRPIMASAGLRVTIETGARFILDPRRKHQPTLISPSPEERACRLAFLNASVDIAAALGAESVSLWSGAPADQAGDGDLYARLTSALAELLRYAEPLGVRLSFEPEPGMFIDTMAKYAKLFDAVKHPLFGLTLDIGHLHCLGDGDVAEYASLWRDRLWNVHIEDMRRGVHEHLPFGQGEIDFGSVFAALRAVRYAGPLHVELPRHSHDAVNTAQHSYASLHRQLAR